MVGHDPALGLGDEVEKFPAQLAPFVSLAFSSACLVLSPLR